MTKLWHKLFLEERPSIGLSFFRIWVAVTTGFHVIPSFFSSHDLYFSGALKVLNYNFFTPGVIDWVQKSPDFAVLGFLALFCVSWFFFLIGFLSWFSCILMTVSCYYFYALNMLHIGTLSWDILLVGLFLMCVTPYHGDYFSVDALIRGDKEAYKRRRPFFVQRLLQMQIASTYFYTAAYKVTAEGNWISGNPMYYLMNYPPEGVTKLFLLKEFLAARPEWCYVLGLAILAMEFFLPFLLFFPKTRVSAIIAGFFFHIALLLTFDVPAIFFFLFPAQLLLFIHPDRVIGWIEKKRAYHQAGRQSVLLFDGNCQFCQASVRQILVMDLFGVVKPVDFHQVADLKDLHPGMTKEKAVSQLHLIEPDGSLHGGYFVLRRLALKCPMLYPMLLVFYFPGSGIVGPVVYRWAAQNRYLLHFNWACKNNACFRHPIRGFFFALIVFLGMSGLPGRQAGPCVYAYQPVPDHRDDEYIYLAKKQEDQKFIHQAQKIYKDALVLYKARRLFEAQEQFKEVENIFLNYKSTRKYLKRIDREIHRQEDLLTTAASIKEFPRKQSLRSWPSQTAFVRKKPISRQPRGFQPPQLKENEQKDKVAEFYQEVRLEKMRRNKLPSDSSQEFSMGEKPPSQNPPGDLEAEVQNRENELKKRQDIIQKALSAGIDQRTEKPKRGFIDLSATKYKEEVNTAFSSKEKGHYTGLPYVFGKEKASKKEAKAKVKASAPKQLSPAELEDTYARAISFYNHKRWSAARKAFTVVIQQNPDYKLAGRYLALIDGKKTLKKSVTRKKRD